MLEKFFDILCAEHKLGAEHSLGAVHFGAQHTSSYILAVVLIEAAPNWTETLDLAGE